MKVSEISFPKPVFIAHTATLVDAMVLMTSDWQDPFPVVKDDRLAGVLTAKSIFAVILKSKDWQTKTVEALITPTLYTCNASDDISTPEKLLKAGAAYVFVLNDGRFIGVLKSARIEHEKQFREQDKKNRSNPSLGGNTDLSTDLHNL